MSESGLRRSFGLGVGFMHCVLTEGFSEDILAFLDTRGHKEDHSNSSAVIQGVYINRNGAVTAHSDSRKQGLAVIVNPST